MKRMRFAVFLLLVVVSVSQHVDALRKAPAKRKCKLDVAVLVDASSSVNVGPEGPANMKALKDFLSNFVTSITSKYEGVQLAMTAFSDKIQPLWNWDKSTDTGYMIKKIEGLKIGGDTHMKKAFKYMQTTIFGDIGNRADADDLMLFMTDGKPLPDSQDPTAIAKRLSEKVSITGVGIADKVNRTLLYEISHPVYLKSYAQLARDVEEIVEQTCEERPPEKCNFDISVLVDASGSITQTSTGGYENWVDVENFLKDFLGFLEFNYPEVQVTLASFGIKNKILWNWDQSRNWDRMIQIIDGKEFEPMGQDTYMKDAFMRMIKDVIGKSGDRPDVPNLMILMSDGEPWPPEAKQDPMEQAKELKDKLGVQILTIGITDKVKQAFMREVASNPDAYVHIRDYAGMRAVVPRIISKGCRL